jgi:parallel beta-helix repeat protein
MLKNSWKIMSMAIMLFIISEWAVAGNLEPPSGPAPSMKTLQEIYDKVAGGTEITSLPYTISSPGFYYITQDLTSPEGSHGITITVDNVTLDLMGFSLIGPEGSGNFDGVHMAWRSNNEIRNGTVMNFPRTGILNEWGGGGHRVINIRAVNNQTGIHLRHRDNLIKGCTAILNTYVGITSGIASTVTGNTTYNNGYSGIYAGEGSIVTGNTSYDNGSNGISTSNGTTVTGNAAYNNSDKGILVFFGSTVTGNTVYDNVSDGIYVGSGSTIIGNTAYNNGVSGIYAGSGSTVTGNTAVNNFGNGIFVGEGSSIIGNTARRNTLYGIRFGGTGNNLVDQNTAYDNSGGNRNTCATCTFGTNHIP